jgi:membrane AbrB-like protein
VAGATELLAAVGVPTAVLFAGFVVGIAYALMVPAGLAAPRSAVVGAQAVVGVTVGTYLERSTLSALGAQWLAVVLVCLLTLGISVLCGIWLSKIAPVDLATSSFGMIAGGAAGIISISRELGADERLVAVLQYVRVLIIVAITPIVAGVAFGVSGSSASVGGSALPHGLLFVALCTGMGIPVARLVRLPAGALVGPMLIAAGFALSGSSFAAHPPSAVMNVAFAVIGLDVGLRFTPASIRQARAVLPFAVGMVVGMIAVCAVLGILLASLAHVNKVDGYLATTPGGLSAVLALAVGSRTNATFILSVQLIRTFVMLLAAPPLARWISQRRPVAVTPEALG